MPECKDCGESEDLEMVKMKGGLGEAARKELIVHADGSLICHECNQKRIDASRSKKVKA